VTSREPLIRELRVPPHTLRRLAAFRPERYPVLFDSAAQGALGTHSVLAAMPRAELILDRTGRVRTRGSVPAGVGEQRGFLTALEAWWQIERAPLDRHGLPFAGGWSVFLGYEVAAEVEPRLALPQPPSALRALALRTPVALVLDGATGRVTAVAEPGEGKALAQLVADAEEDARAPESADEHGHEILSVEGAGPCIEEESPGRFLERVRCAQDYIAAGDLYQANLSRWWRSRWDPARSPAALYERLRRANPAPFAAFAQHGGYAILSSSPERLLRIENRAISTRPIAGTRPRSRRPGEDAPEAAALAAHPKERAEHVMLIDLERNDLGRVCEPGTVRVDELMVVETYEHVHHIVSSVSGCLREEVSPIGALRAVFPGGTITGCPKFRCMQIIAELEGVGRGAYTGSLGYIGPDGSADFNILIRTLTLDGANLELRAGAGIVADSIPERELEETRAKARGLLAALGVPASDAEAHR
jgi:anthranilate synthase component 1